MFSSIEDHLYKYLNYYKYAPSSIRKIFGDVYKTIPYSLRYGKHFKLFNNLLKESKSWDIKEIQSFQLNKINYILDVAKNNVPFYKKTLKYVNLPLKDINEFKENIPFVTKEDVRNNYASFINENVRNSKLVRCTTGGTTGEPLPFFLIKGLNRTKEFVHLNDLWSRIGYKDGDSRLVLRSAIIKNKKTNDLWYYDPIKNRYFFSSFKIDDKHLEEFLVLYHDIKPRFLHVYPSVLTNLASLIKAHKIKLKHFPQGILASSEHSFPNQIALFKDVFHCRVIRWYGLGEEVALAGSCEFNYNYHCSNTYGMTELINSNNNEVTTENDRGEIVGTAFHNYAMPLIRYKTADYAYFGGNSCNDCGRIGLLFNNIDGRAQETIIDKNGNKHSLGPFIFGMHEIIWGKVRKIQFIQSEAGKLTLMLVISKYSQKDMLYYIQEYLLDKFKNNFIIEIKFVDEIKPTAIGKHKYLIQNMDVS